VAPTEPDAPGRIATITGALLLGGASSRLGRDKSRLPLAGVASATRTARLLRGLFEEVLLVGGDPPPDAPGRRIPDVEGPRCALRGLVSALQAAGRDRVLVLATDLPLVTPDLLLALVAWPEADAVVPRTGDGAQSLCALYRRDPVLSAARARLDAGELGVRDLLDAIGTAVLDEAELARLDPEGIALTNLNTPDDLARVESLLARSPRPGGASDPAAK
jgi:molybdopterin-guanine dinucleotide biosynthesis protein A